MTKATRRCHSTVRGHHCHEAGRIGRSARGHGPGLGPRLLGLSARWHLPAPGPRLQVRVPEPGHRRQLHDLPDLFAQPGAAAVVARAPAAGRDLRGLSLVLPAARPGLPVRPGPPPALAEGAALGPLLSQPPHRLASVLPEAVTVRRTYPGSPASASSA